MTNEPESSNCLPNNCLPGLKQIRDALGLTQGQVAAAAGLYGGFVGGVEGGKKNCTVDNLKKLYRALGCDPADLTEGASPERLSAIKINYHLRQIVREKEKAS